MSMVQKKKCYIMNIAQFKNGGIPLQILSKKLFAIYCNEIEASCKDLTEAGSYGKDGKFEFI